MDSRQKVGLPRMHAALAAAARGWPVFPLFPGSKRPAIPGWQRHATTDPDVLAVWWERRPYNIGIACGPARLLVLDLDRPHQTASYGELLARLGVDQPTYTVATPRGEHRYYQVDVATPGLTTVGQLAVGVDTRAAGGYVVGAGSVRCVAGRAVRYRVTSPPDVVVRHAPRRLLEALASRRRDNAATTTAPELAIGRGGAFVWAAVTGEVGRVLAATSGGRNVAVFTAALRLGRLAAAGLLDEKMVVALLGAACENHLGVDGFTAAEADRAIDNGLRYGRRRSRGSLSAHRCGES